MNNKAMFAVLGALSAAAAVVPAVQAATASQQKSEQQNGLVLYSGAQGQMQNVNWHTSHSSHSSHSSSRY